MASSKPPVNPGKGTGTWQRLTLSLFGICIIEVSWRWAVGHLYSLPTPALAGFVSLTTNSMYVIGSIVVFMITGRMVYEWHLGTQQVQEVTSETENEVQNIKEEITGNRSPKDFLGDDDAL